MFSIMGLVVVFWGLVWQDLLILIIFFINVISFVVCSHPL